MSFDISSVRTRFFELRINEQLFEIEPPTKKMLSAIAEAQKSNDFDQLVEDLAVVLSKNKQNHTFTAKSLENFTIDQIGMLIKAYFGWVREVQTDPNL